MLQGPSVAKRSPYLTWLSTVVVATSTPPMRAETTVPAGAGAPFRVALPQNDSGGLGGKP